MDPTEEYHDPDYPGTSVNVKEEHPGESILEKVDKTKEIIRREFTKELEIREDEIMQIDQRMLNARRLLHRLRYSLVNSYYRDQRLQLTGNQIEDEVAGQHELRARTDASTILRGQRRLHPSVRKLLGKQVVDLEDIFRHRAPRNKIRKDYLAMVQTRNYTIAADKTKTLRPEVKLEPETDEVPCASKPKKVPRHIEPKIENIVTLDEATRNKMKHRYRIVIGNTSKYAPAASQLDRSTHKWLLYIRGPPQQPEISSVVTAVTARLHHSYAPHHTVHIDKTPYHISRRGWGEFPAKIELHFALPDRNRPATVEHTIKLDRNFTGLQVLGAETVVDVWLYSTQEMLKYEFKETMQTDTHTEIQSEKQLKQEPVEPEIENVNNNEMVNNEKTEHWMDFFTSETTELDVDEMIIKPVKKEINDTKNDLEDYIETNVITKENIKQEIEYETDTLNNEDPNVINGQNCEFISPMVKSKPLDDYSVNSNVKCIENSIENVPDEILNQKISPKKRIMKYMDPATGKIYYLEMDRNLDLTKVQEIVINSKGNVKTAKISPIKPNGLKNVRKPKGGVSLLKPEVKNLLKNENIATKKESNNVLKVKNTYTHIENDHCYLGSTWTKNNSVPKVTESMPKETKCEIKSENEDLVLKQEVTLYDCLCCAVKRFTCVRVAVNYLLKKIPLISTIARDSDYVKHFPFIVEKEETYWKYDFAKRRNIEWSRAKTINKMLIKHLKTEEPIWRTKQILIYSRLHGFYPIRQEALQMDTDKQVNEWSSWNDLENTRKLESNIKEIYPHASDINSLTIFNSEDFANSSLSESINLTDSDEEIDIVKCDTSVKIKKEVLPENSDGLTVLPVENEDDRLRFLFIEWKCADIGIELRNEDVGEGYSYSAVHAVMLSAVRSFAEELTRGALAARLAEAPRATRVPPVWTGSSTSKTPISLEHVYRAAANPRLQLLTSRALGVEKKHTYSI